MFYTEPGGSKVAFASAVWVVVWLLISSLISEVTFGLRQQLNKVKRLGQYVLERRIGEGGMGIVYEARHEMLRRKTAIKLLPMGRATEKAVDRFEREVVLTSRLTHPNTVAIYDFGRTAQGVFYYAMELVDGIDLQKTIELYGAMDPGRVIHLLRQVCGALGEAHEVGLVHRDVKASNVIVGRRGGMHDVVTVVDFGLVGPCGGDVERTANGTHVVEGTPMYIAPEAIIGKPLDARSDLYALGVLAYFMLTGRMPFDGRDFNEIAEQHLRATPVPPSRYARVPADLERIVLRCIAKNPADRPQRAAELTDWLNRCDHADRWTDDAVSRAGNSEQPPKTSGFRMRRAELATTADAHAWTS